jgi:hypothetical protein
LAFGSNVRWRHQWNLARFHVWTKWCSTTFSTEHNLVFHWRSGCELLERKLHHGKITSRDLFASLRLLSIDEEGWFDVIDRCLLIGNINLMELIVVERWERLIW